MGGRRGRGKGREGEGGTCSNVLGIDAPALSRHEDKTAATGNM